MTRSELDQKWAEFLGVESPTLDERLRILTKIWNEYSDNQAVVAPCIMTEAYDFCIENFGFLDFTKSQNVFRFKRKEDLFFFVLRYSNYIEKVRCNSS